MFKQIEKVYFLLSAFCDYHSFARCLLGFGGEKAFYKVRSIT
jgi:hypothetical protein